jgi:hypothetical protein
VLAVAGGFSYPQNLWIKMWKNRVECPESGGTITDMWQCPKITQLIFP